MTKESKPPLPPAEPLPHNLAPTLTRRTALRCLVSLPGFAGLAGCFGNDGIAVHPTAPASATASPLVEYFAQAPDAMSAAGAVATMGAPLPVQATSPVLSTSRLHGGNAAYLFGGPGATGIATASLPSALPSYDFAVTLWLQVALPGRGNLLVIQGESEPILTLAMSADTSLTAYWNGVATPSAVSSALGPLRDGGWHHVGIQSQGGILQLLVDGSLIASATAPAAPLAAVSTSLQIGGGATSKWVGSVDSVRVYGSAIPLNQYPLLVYKWTKLKPTNLAYGLGVYYPFNGNAKNDVGSGLDGELFNVSPAADRWGAEGRAYGFNGSDSYIVLGSNLDAIDADFAISFFVRSTARAPMVAFSATGGSAGIDVVFNLGSAIALFFDGVPQPGLSFGISGALCDGQWHAIVVQRAAGSVQLYIDGGLKASAQNAVEIFGVGSVIKFGAPTLPSLAANWNGAIDDISIWDISFTMPQVLDLGSMQFRPRDGAGLVASNGRFWLLGGWNPADTPITNSQVWSSLDGINWSFIGNAAWEGRHDAGYATLNNRLWVVGGDRNRGHYQNDVWSSADGVDWTLATNSVPWANRASHYVLSFANRLWLMGGMQIFESGPPYVAYNDVYSSADGVNWELVSPSAGWSPRGLIMGGVVFDGAMWVIGGGTYDIRTYTNDVWKSVDGVNWVQVTPAAAWAPRQYHNIAAFAGKLWVLGGATDGTGGSNDVWYSSDGALWTELPGTPWINRHAASACATDSMLLVTCGSDQNVYNDVWALTYAS